MKKDETLREYWLEGDGAKPLSVNVKSQSWDWIYIMVPLLILAVMCCGLVLTWC